MGTIEKWVDLPARPLVNILSYRLNETKMVPYPYCHLIEELWSSSLINRHSSPLRK